MSSSGKRSVTYRCPQCKAKLSARPEDAGKRRECPECGKRLKVPGTARQGSGEDRASSAPNETGQGAGQGVGHVSFVCPLCGTRMHAARDQIGQKLVCPDCLESVVVPGQSPPRQKKSPAAEPPAADASASQSSNADARSSSPSDAQGDAGADDDYQLSEPVDLPSNRSVNDELAALLERHGASDEGDDRDRDRDAASSSDAHNKASQDSGTSPDEEFSVPCPVCDSLLRATREEIGSTQKCPDCYSKVKVVPPRPKRRRVNEVREADYRDDQFALGPPVEVGFERPGLNDLAPRTAGQDAMDRAAQEHERRRHEEPELPARPLWTGVFEFFQDIVVVARLVIGAAAVGVTLGLSLMVAGWLGSSAPAAYFYGLVGSLFVFLLIIFTAIFTSSNGLTILQESASGVRKIEDWPPANVVEWFGESMWVQLALFFAITPGMLVVLTSHITRIPPSLAWLLVGFSAYAFFPILQLSLLESGSLANPISPPILRSLREQMPLWGTFYLMTFGLAVVAVIAIFSLGSNPPMVVCLLFGGLIMFELFLYFRLLGRLAWACQMIPRKEDEKEPTEAEDKSSEE